MKIGEKIGATSHWRRIQDEEASLGEEAMMIRGGRYLGWRRWGGYRGKRRLQKCVAPEWNKHIYCMYVTHMNLYEYHVMYFMWHWTHKSRIRCSAPASVHPSCSVCCSVCCSMCCSKLQCVAMCCSACAFEDVLLSFCSCVAAMTRRSKRKRLDLSVLWDGLCCLLPSCVAILSLVLLQQCCVVLYTYTLTHTHTHTHIHTHTHAHTHTHTHTYTHTHAHTNKHKHGHANKHMFPQRPVQHLMEGRGEVDL